MKPVENKVIEVQLTVIGETDVLIFNLDEGNPEKYIINLNDPAGQTQIKEVLAKLLEMLLDMSFILELKIAEEYSKGLYKDVCLEYIAELNREICQVKESITKALK